MRNVCVVLFISVCFSIGNSCVSKKPIIVEKVETKRRAILVEPQWKVKNNTIWLIAPIVGVAAGGAYGYYSDVYKGLENQEQNTAAFGGVGLLSGFLMAGWISLHTMKVKNVSVKTSNQNQWVRKYNREVSENYHLLNASDEGKLLLAPKNLTKELSKLKKEYEAMMFEMESNELIAWEELLTYKAFLRNDYFYFYPEEKKPFYDLLVSKEMNAAYAILNDKMLQIIGQPHNKLRVDQIAAFSNNHKGFYMKISSTQKRELKEMGDAYVSAFYASAFQEIREKELKSIDKNEFTSVVGVELIYRNVVDVAGGFVNLPVVTSMLADLKELKGEIITRNEKEIAEYFRGIRNRGELAKAKYRFLNNINQNASVQRLVGLTHALERKFVAEEKRKEIELARLARQREQKKIDDMMRETTASGEPTEAQMRFAIQSQVDLKNRKIEQISNTQLDKQNPMNLPMVLGGMFLKDTEVVLEYFRKIACEKSASRGGYVCDYSIKQKIKGGVSGGMMDSMMGEIGAGMADIETGRFVKTNEGWMLVEIME